MYTLKKNQSKWGHAIGTMVFSPLHNVLWSFPIGTYESTVSVFEAAYYSTGPKLHYATSSVLIHAYVYYSYNYSYNNAAACPHVLPSSFKSISNIKCQGDPWWKIIHISYVDRYYQTILVHQL